MCGRIALHTPPSRVARQLQATVDPSVSEIPGPSWNVAPSKGLLAVGMTRPPSAAPDEAAVRTLTHLQWGLVPYWAKDPSIGNRMINARAESVATKPAFRHAFARHRCLIVADGFYEWRREPDDPKRRTPFYFRRADGGLLLFAGLWDRWRDRTRPDDEAAMLRTGTIITTQAGPDLAAVHDRMPVVVEADEVDRWLKGEDGDVDVTAVSALLRPSPAGVLVGHRVDPRVNNPRNDGPDLVDEAVDAEPEPSDRLF